MDLIDKSQTTGDYASAQFPVVLLGVVMLLMLSVGCPVEDVCVRFEQLSIC